MKKRLALSLNLQHFGGETLQELLQNRASVHDKQKSILDKADTENRDLTTEEATEFSNLESEFQAVETKIKAAEAKEARAGVIAAREALLNQAATPVFRPLALSGAPVQEQQKDTAGFDNFGEFVNALRFGDSKGRLHNLATGQGEGGGKQVPEAFADQIMRVVRNEYSMGTGAAGGIMVPGQFDPNILRLNAEAAIVRSRATVLPAGDPPDAKLTIPALSQGSKGVYGGVEVKWISEGKTKPESPDANLTEVSLQPEEVAATMTVTDKLLRNWAAADSFIRNLLTSAMMAAEDMAFLRGDGIGKPSGVMNAIGGLKVNRQTANQIKYLDVVMMLSKLLPESVSNALFVANQSLLPQVATLQDPAGRYIYIQGDATKGIPSTLAGIPIRFTGKTSTLGNKGDLVLVDLSYYLIKDGSGPFIAASEHVLFRDNKTVIKAFWNVDGEPWVVEPLTLEDGVTQVSPYVTLDVPS